MRIQHYIYITISAFLMQAFFTASIYAQAKKDNRPLVQISGIIAADSKTPIPFATVRIKNTTRGTIATVEGFYSLPAAEKDTLEYVALGFKTLQFIIPTNVPEHKITNNVELKGDTLTFETVDIYPWPSKEDFRQAFLNLKVEDDAYDRAKENLDQKKLQELYESLARDGKENQIYALQQIAQSYYYAGGQRNYSMMGGGNVPIPTSLLNPFAWTQFLQAIREGKFKQKK